jgi:hypothetical protein
MVNRALAIHQIIALNIFRVVRCSKRRLVLSYLYMIK